MTGTKWVFYLKISFRAPQATKNNKTLRRLKYLILENRWFEIQKGSVRSEKVIKSSIKSNTELKMFSRIKDFLTVKDTGDFTLRENRIVLPSIYWNLAINLAHAGKLGLTKTKTLLRSRVFFPNIDKIAAQVLGLCTSCKSVTPIWPT